MYYLMKLELKKHKMGWYIKGAILANLIIVGMLALLTLIEKLESETIFRTANDFFMFSGLLVRGTFIVFAAVLISKIIIDEFKNRTSFVMFSYPINRKKIMATKLILIFSLTLITMILSTCFVVFSFIGLNEVFQLTPNVEFSEQLIRPELMSMMVFNLAAAGSALVPLYFGMRKFSIPATIVSGVLITIITNSSFGPDFSLVNLFYIPIVLTFMAIGIIIFTIRNMNQLELN
ncbi:ABC transporter permease [Alkalicoccobacillus murimartini]|uniref:ABC-type transport system involved in multi-copper enzyme maturation permease subunit n=1 Tax=Alkalicoccobacillus murimartini TaxID=171685 RepID=A0ABT9YJU9_9BACI|nr:ABC transporter permease [Alkalicoccobacillus murimartini]MDQ0207492.1 ABC-type transport system involved in multi-copper enzyme maturation permease subunit [Alkalicoccobacillus murimartini]